MTEPTTALAIKSSYLPPPSRDEFGAMIEMANSLAKAQGFLPAHFYGQPYKILAAILYGRDLGISATNALQHIIVIEGKATADAQLIGMLVRRAGHQMVDETTDIASTVTITRNDGTVHEATFTIQDAQRAGLVRAGGAWTKYPAAMLYARALTACARKGAQDALMGTVYTPEELGVEVDGEGAVIMPPSTETGEIPPSMALPESREALETAQEILRNSQTPETAPSGSAATSNGKRRGRPLGSKNHAKTEPNRAEGLGATADDGGVAGRTASESPLMDRPSEPSPAPAFGDDDEIMALVHLRKQLHSLASRLRKYQYLEKGASLPAMPLWEKEIERTLGIFIQRKFDSSDLTLEEISEEGLQAAIEDLKTYIAKYEAPEGDDDPNSGEQDPLEAAEPTEELSSQGGQSSGGQGTADAATQMSTMPAQGTSASASPGLQSAAQSAVAVSALPSAGAQAETTVVSVHKPIVRNPVNAVRRTAEPTQIDPAAAFERARMVADLRNRTTALLATREGLINLSSKDEERLRTKADATMETIAQNSFQRPVKDLDTGQLDVLIQRAKAAAK